MEVCKAVGGEIVSADSVQIYRRLDVGANKPSAEDLAAVRHHLVNILDPGSEEYTVGQWLRAAYAAIDDVLQRGKVPLVVGGTMLYTQWLVQGQPDAPEGDAATQQIVRTILAPFEATGDWDGGLELLRAVNATRAAQLNKNDWVRLGRSLQISMDMRQGDEVFTGERTGAASERYDVRSYFIVADRAEAARRITQRCQAMLSSGLLQEVAALLHAGLLPKESSPGRAIGYRQMREYLLRPDPHAGDAEALVQFYSDFCTATRRYASDQLKWFRSSKGTEFVWCARDFADPNSVPSIARAIAEDLSLDEHCHQAKRMDATQLQLREDNLAQAKQMRLFIQPDLRKTMSAGAFAQLQRQADQCTALAQGIPHLPQQEVNSLS
ncbi:IPP transferase-domain-containing protein [Tribonema minus]|uniref:tRNA dimethylallyltransferase n=1 Tax=Tribonema minus TaxID=303371 RepID=A0A835YP32_9STRA|nr:IPP transferase-domain-containing protein [Tribonema minus]